MILGIWRCGHLASLVRGSVILLSAVPIGKALCGLQAGSIGLDSPWLYLRAVSDPARLWIQSGRFLWNEMTVDCRLKRVYVAGVVLQWSALFVMPKYPPVDAVVSRFNIQTLQHPMHPVP